MICGASNIDINFIRRFMNQISKCFIIIGGHKGVEQTVRVNAMTHSIRYKVNMKYDHIRDMSMRLYSIYTEEKPCKVYILDNDYENNQYKYKFTEYLPIEIDIIVVNSHHCG